ncbi:MAG: helix-turn-helix domain-containing protein [Oscillospiraceae bacterium]|uniref:helix-turn-helix domain-containing protein n=1 Tax=Hominenteromicrobium sp. TaxID=3073581 RepID=UPI0039963770
MQIGDRIRELRVDRDLTQANIANILKTSQSYYSEYELGKRAIPIQHIITLCLFYGVSADYILGLPKGLQWPR